MNTKDLIHLGVPEGEAMQCAHAFIRGYIAAGNDGGALAEDVFRIVADPAAYFDDPLRGPLARALYRPAYMPRAELAPWRQWGSDLEPEAVLRGIQFAMDRGAAPERPADYQITNTSERVVNFILSTAFQHEFWSGLR